MAVSAGNVTLAEPAAHFPVFLLWAGLISDRRSAVQPNHVSNCPGSQAACAYAPPGPATGEPRTLLYDRAAGQADIFGFDAPGKVNLDTPNTRLENFVGPDGRRNFIWNGRSQILLYDRSAGQADVVGFDSTGKTNLDTVNFGLRTAFENILVLRSGV
ncbi:MAG: hypothetical protein ACREQX_10065 [Candidatus Binataceae bacterium]